MGLKEPFNAVSHMVGAGLAIAFLPIVLLRAEHGGAMAMVAAALYGATLVAVFAMSAVYHSVTHPRASPWLFRLDQCMIYLLIAGTYTPVALLLVQGSLGWLLFAIEWGLAATGISLLLTVHRTPQWIHQAAYIVLGWAALLALPRLLGLHWLALALLLAGGVAYTGGSALYNRDRKTTWGIGDHGVWHLLVILGAAAHAVFIMAFIV
ncbi:MAG: hemolysin III family protein [bacterium]